MRRIPFLVAYLAGVAFLQFASPWAALNIAVRTADGLQPAGFATLLVPMAMILLAALRGHAIGSPQLFTWPATALLVSGLPFFLGWGLAATGHGVPAPGTLADTILGFAVLVGTVVPLVLHAACCFRGAAPAQPAWVKSAA